MFVGSPCRAPAGCAAATIPVNNQNAHLSASPSAFFRPSRAFETDSNSVCLPSIRPSSRQKSAPCSAVTRCDGNETVPSRVAAKRGVTGGRRQKGQHHQVHAFAVAAPEVGKSGEAAMAETAPLPSVGFLGLGFMGLEMAMNMQSDLAGRGGKLAVHNRTRDKASPLLEAGASWVESPVELAASCDIVFSMLADDMALEAVFSSYISGGPRPGGVFADCSTVLPSTADVLAERAERSGITYVSCPVFGRPDAARGRRLLMVLAGKKEALERVKPFLLPLASGFIEAGDKPSAANALKLVGNFHISSAIEMMAEGMTLADKCGIPRDALVQFYNTMLPGPIFAGYGGRMAADDFVRTKENPGFGMGLAMKDVSHMLSLAKANQMSLPMAELVLSRLEKGVAAGRGDLDWSAIATVVREEASSPP